ncbi:YitT family protein [Paenibacillus septentrionalis]|uniref:YitT family protein n=1 Tax=Paenibacillus septentrionalis TaxID=429342 RepID=A0ABW1V227_9BACL
MAAYTFSKKQIITNFIWMTLSSILLAFGFNMLLIPLELLSGGISGLAMVIGYITKSNIGWLYLVLNLPVLIWGWFVLGKKIIIWSVYSVLTSSLFMQILPVHPLADDVLLGAVYGGIAVGLASGIALRFGGSTGGFDIVASIVTMKKDLPVGIILTSLNGLVVALHILFTHDFELAMYSLVSIFVTGKIIDLIHIKHLKVTVFIITTQTDAMLKQLLNHPRGITVIKTRGAFTSNDRDMLMTVRTRYELADLKKQVKSIDQYAFVNIVETVAVIGEFRKIREN